ncbi:uncharacterized protein LOC126837529 [Adelges cooleyi]|uniref:uncharacterized protein LOC126837529 n=1 Tax=Adelges cooleyi TaxID=133065 RepID=UPI00217FA47B|nr:uncharacterized protein LOC126837529 [Adelges cooleyi]
MMNIKIVLLLNLAAYAACGGGLEPPLAGSLDDDEWEYEDVNNNIELSKPIQPIRVPTSERHGSVEISETIEPSEPIGPSEPIIEPSEVASTSRGVTPSNRHPIGVYYDYHGDPAVASRDGSNHSNEGTQNFTSTGVVTILDSVTQSFDGETLVINGIYVPEIQAEDLRWIQWGEGTLKINGMENERFKGIPGKGTLIF